LIATTKQRAADWVNRKDESTDLLGRDMAEVDFPTADWDAEKTNIGALGGCLTPGRRRNSRSGWRSILLGVCLVVTHLQQAPSAPFEIYGLQYRNPSLVFSFQTETNNNYSVQFSTSSVQPTWTLVSSVLGTGSPATITNVIETTSQGFFRIQNASASSVTVSANEVKTVAKGIYDQIAAGIPFAGSNIALIFGIFQVPTIASTNGAEFQEQLDSRLPFLMDFQADGIAAKLNEEFFVTLDSLLNVMAAKGITASDPPGPLTRDYLAAKLAPLLVKTNYSPAEVLPALVLALGSERASRSGLPGADLVWGDGLLDSLQFGLLVQSLTYQPGSALPPSHPVTRSGAAADPRTTVRTPLGVVPVPKWVGNVVHVGEEIGHSLSEELLTAMASHFLRFPLGYVDTPKAILCASLLLYSYSITVQADPNEILSSCPLPDRTSLTATVLYDFTGQSTAAQIGVFLSTCDLPEWGYQLGKEVEWRLTDQLPEHGKLEDRSYGDRR
jgi:hypothetical protein